jgi:hypothetical protein
MSKSNKKKSSKNTAPVQSAQSISVWQQVRLIQATKSASDSLLGSLDMRHAGAGNIWEFSLCGNPANPNTETGTADIDRWTCTCESYVKYGIFCAHMACALMIVGEQGFEETCQATGGFILEKDERQETGCPINDPIFGEDYKPGDSAV